MHATHGCWAFCTCTTGPKPNVRTHHHPRDTNPKIGAHGTPRPSWYWANAKLLRDGEKLILISHFSAIAAAASVAEVRPRYDVIDFFYWSHWKAQA